MSTCALNHGSIKGGTLASKGRMSYLITTMFRPKGPVMSNQLDKSKVNMYSWKYMNIYILILWIVYAYYIML